MTPTLPGSMLASAAITSRLKAARPVAASSARRISCGRVGRGSRPPAIAISSSAATA